MNVCIDSGYFQCNRFDASILPEGMTDVGGGARGQGQAGRAEGGPTEEQTHAG